MARQNVVSAIPLDVIWDESYRVLDARRVDGLSAGRIEEQLRGEVVFLVADIGSDLVRLSGADRDRFWNDEARHRLVPPDKAQSFRRADYAGGYCYLASLWHDAGSRRFVVFERYH